MNFGGIFYHSQRFATLGSSFKISPTTFPFFSLPFSQRQGPGEREQDERGDGLTATTSTERGLSPPGGVVGGTTPRRSPTVLTPPPALLPFPIFLSHSPLHLPSSAGVQGKNWSPGSDCSCGTAQLRELGQTTCLLSASDCPLREWAS